MKKIPLVYKYSIFIWAILIVVTFYFIINEKRNNIDNVSKSIIKAALMQDSSFRFWAASHGGVYVKATEKTPPNPYLSHIKNRDVVTKDVNLTLMNPAYMLRQMMHDYEGLYGLKGHITSLNVLNKKYNSPDKWEEKILKRLEKTKQKDVVYEYVSKDDQNYLRAFQPLMVKKNCLKCHGFQGYKIGQIRGGVSMTLPLKEFESQHSVLVYKLIGIFLVIFLTGVFFIKYFYNKYTAVRKEEENLYNLLEKSENYYKGVVNTSQNIILVNQNKKLENANQAFYDFTGFKDLNSFLEKYECICDLFIQKEGYLQKTMEDGKYWLNYVYENKDIIHKAIIEKEKKRYIFKINVDELIVDHKIRYVAVFNDITELIEKEDLMIAQSRHAAMGEMISMIAHQWRQPISTISMGANNILADLELNEKIENKDLKEISYSILKQTKHLSKTIDDFKNYFKPHRSKEEVYVNDVIDESISIVGKSLQNNNIELNKEYKSDMKISLFSRELLQVIINIVKNAKEALIENGKENKQIDIYTYEDKKCIHIKICDNGEGVDKENLEKIFDPYFTTKKNINGTGLGLYMSKTIIEKHLKGKISCFNDNGACFLITIEKEQE